jgi:phosphoribosylglycinamide formyltransferase-1
MLKIGVLGSGSGTNLQSIVNAIEAGTLDARVVCVLSDVAGAGILARAARHGIPSQVIDPSPYRTKLDGLAEQRAVEVLHAFGVDTVVLAGFMRVVKAGLLRAFPQRVLNIHPALLPAFPGLAAWRQALDYGVKVAGCTVHLVDEGIDSGPIIVQRCVPVLDGDTPESLHARIQAEEHQAYPEALRLLAAGRLGFDGRRVRVLASAGAAAARNGNHSGGA